MASTCETTDVIWHLRRLGEDTRKRTANVIRVTRRERWDRGEEMKQAEQQTVDLGLCLYGRGELKSS
jgi:hypothetical protein